MYFLYAGETPLARGSSAHTHSGSAQKKLKKSETPLVRGSSAHTHSGSVNAQRAQARAPAACRFGKHFFVLRIQGNIVSVYLSMYLSMYLRI